MTMQLTPEEKEKIRLKHLAGVEKKLLGDWKPEEKKSARPIPQELSVGRIIEDPVKWFHGVTFGEVPPVTKPLENPPCGLPSSSCFDARSKLNAALEEISRGKQSAAMYSSWWREARNELWELKKKVSGAPEITGPRKEEK